MITHAAMPKPWLLAIHTPYDPEFVEHIKKVPTAKWDTYQRSWQIQVQFVSHLLRECVDFLTPQDKEMLESVITYTAPDVSPVLASGALYKYQVDAFRYLVRKQDALLCLDLGLGKTISSLAYAAWLRKEGKVDIVLVISPKSVLSHWKREADDHFTGLLKAVIVDGMRRKRRLAWDVEGADTFILNYHILSDLDSFEEAWKGKRIIVIADEVTRIKSYRSIRTQRMFRLPAEYRIGLTGKPIENNLKELYTIVDWVRPRFFGLWKEFEKRHILYDDWGKPKKYLDLETVRDMLPFVMHRLTKEQAKVDLPPLTREDYEVSLSPEESTEYRSIQAQLTSLIDSGTIDNNSIFAWLTIARMYCDHPRLVKESDSDSAKKIVVECINSSKLNELLAVLDEIHSPVVIFTQYAKMAHLLVDTIKHRKTFLVTGELNRTQQDETLAAFAKEGGILVSTDTIAYGVNIQSASYIIHYDLPWNPAVVEQRIARLHRIGQKNPVTSISLVVKDLDKIERRVRDILQTKESLSNTLLEATT